MSLLYVCVAHIIFNKLLFKPTAKQPRMHKFCMAAIRVKPFLIYTATVHKRIDVEEIALCKRYKGH